MKKEKETRREENNNVNVMAAYSFENIYLQIASVKVKASDGENFETLLYYKNTLIRLDYAQKLKLNAVKTFTTVKESGGLIKVNEVFLKIFDDEQENALCIPVLFTITKNMFKMPTQKLRKSSKFVLEGYHYLKGIKLANVPPSELTLFVGSNAPEAFMQLELRRGMQYQQCAIKTPLVTHW